MKKGIAILMAVVLILAVCASCMSPAERLAKMLELGDQYLLDLDYENAVVQFLKAIEIDPMNISAHLGLARAYIGLEQYDDAEEALRNLLEIDEENEEAYELLQDLFDASGDMRKLADLLEEMRDNGLESLIVFGTVNGVVADGAALLNSDDASALSGVRGDIMRGSKQARRVNSSNDGSYTTYLKRGTYTLKLTKSGYLPAEQSFEVRRNETTNMPRIAMIPESNGVGTVAGQVIDALTGRGVSNATITIYDSAGNTSEQTHSDNSGYYEISDDAGYYRVSVEATGYTNTERMISVYGEHELHNQNLAMTPILNEGEVRIVLTWGSSPSDLDSHLVGPTPGGSQFHIYYSSKTNYSDAGDSVLMADLDLDDTSSYGPETTSIYRAVAGTYAFYIYDYSNGGDTSSTAMASSGAMVSVYTSVGLAREFYVPPQLVGDTWHVFDLVNGELRMPDSDTDPIPMYRDGTPQSGGDEGEHEDYDYEEFTGTPLQLSSRAYNTVLNATGISANTTAMDLADTFGLPDEYDSTEDLRNDMNNGCDFDNPYGESGNYLYWNDLGLYTSFNPANGRVTYVTFYSMYESGSALDSVQPFTPSDLVSDSRISGLLRLTNAADIIQYLNDNDIQAERYDYSFSISLTNDSMMYMYSYEGTTSKDFSITTGNGEYVYVGFDPQNKFTSLSVSFAT